MPGDSKTIGAFLRSRRERLSPQSVGLPVGARRRTPGLRREEVAELAGISVDWYVRLEQGRSVTPSLQTVNAIARALKLDPMECAHFQELALQGQRRPFEREQVPAEIQRMIDRMNLPAYVTGRRWDLLAWNDAADALLGPFGAIPEADRNILLMMLTRPGARTLFGDGWEREARRMIARFRVTHDFWSWDPAFVDLLSRLREGCAEFPGWWESHELHDQAGGVKTLNHPGVGAVTYEFNAFQVSNDPSLRLAIYTALETDSRSPGP